MAEKNALVEYMQKLKNMADYLARGYILQSPDDEKAIEIVNSDITSKRNAFSIKRYNIYDELEVSYMGEQQSIGILMRYIEEGEYERQIKGKVDFDEPYTPKPDNAEFYKRIMKRVNVILKTMPLFLIVRNNIPLNSCDFCELIAEYLDEEELSFYDGEIDSSSLIYSTQEQCFCVVNSEGEIMIKDMDIHEAMYLYNQFLMEKEQRVLRKRAIEGIQSKKEEDRPHSEERE